LPAAVRSIRNSFPDSDGETILNVEASAVSTVASPASSPPGGFSQAE
jgi:hypothetical protein